MNKKEQYSEEMYYSPEDKCFYMSIGPVGKDGMQPHIVIPIKDAEGLAEFISSIVEDEKRRLAKVN